jgi:hypothetical protein
MTETICRCGQPTSGAWLCDDCGKTLDHAIINVGIYTHDLDIVLTRRTRYSTTTATKTTTGKVQPLVIDMRWADRSGTGSQLTYDAKATIIAWTQTIKDDQPQLAGPACPHCLHVSCSQTRRRRWPTDTIGSMIHYLARQRRHILSQQWAPDILDELLDLEHRLTWMVDRPADRWYAGRCSVNLEGQECDAELYARDDRGHIDCPKCGIRHDVAERREVLLGEAKNYLVTATEAATALMAWTDYDGSENKLVDRIRKWRDRDQLEVADVTSLYGRDRHLYRLGDIQDLLVKTAQRQQAQTLSA